MIPYSRPKRSDLYTLSWSKLPENHTLHSGTYLYSPYMAVAPPPLRELKRHLELVSYIYIARSSDNSDGTILKFLEFLTKLSGQTTPYSTAIIEVWLDKTFVMTFVSSRSFC